MLDLLGVLEHAKNTILTSIFNIFIPRKTPFLMTRALRSVVDSSRGTLNKIILVTQLLLAANAISFNSFSQTPPTSLARTSSPTVKTIHVKFKEKFKPSIAISGRSSRSGLPMMDQLSEKHNALTLQRLFPHAGKFEKAHRAFGLHLWYEITFTKETQLRKVISDYNNLEYFEHVEELKPYQAIWKENETFTPYRNPDILPSGSNDPLFNDQWHFNNTGQKDGLINADINLLNAWKIETGSPDVIVAVIDGGIDFDHPDIKASAWTNPGEIPFNGVDDDNNGYVDDFHGYAFGDRQSTIIGDMHGTHVAGTIAAVSNNSIGVAGIAGGDGTGNGVRLMSCATFGAFGVDRGFEDAMVYAADNGAVISQNSWGGGSTAIQAAIDYFIERAGYDNSEENFENDIQTGPMAGGLVIFAAGNKNSNKMSDGYPASYAKSIAVASTNRFDERSFFSNYGPWIDISAPGEEVVSAAGGLYYTASGTSMACPHVSGVAALVASYLKRPGLTATQVWNRIRSGTRSLSATNPGLDGELGVGRLDAVLALRDPDNTPPSPIADFHVTEVNYTSVVLEWTATGESGNIGQSGEFDIRYSTNPITEQNFNEARRGKNIPIPPPSGQHVTFRLTDLNPAVSYYVAIKALDMFNNPSTVSAISVTTLQPPKPEAVTASLTAELFTGGTSTKDLLIKNIGQDELVVRFGVPILNNPIIGKPGNTKGRLFAINGATSTIEELNIKNGDVIRSIPLPETSTNFKEGLAFDGKYLYYGKGPTVYKINAETGTVLRYFNFPGYYIIGLGWSGQYLYIQAPQGGSIAQMLEVNSDNGTVLRKFGYGDGEISFGGNRGTIYAATGANVAEKALSTGEVLKSFATTGPVKGVGYSNAENLIFIAAGSLMQGINPANGNVVYTFPFNTANTTGVAADEYASRWLQVDDAPVTIQAGATAALPVKFIATGLETTQLTGNVTIISENVDEDNITVPVTMNVTSATELDFVSELDLGTQYIGYPVDTVFQLSNLGFGQTLTITNIHSNDNRITTSISSVTLAPGTSVPLTISINATLEGPISTTISMTSNDPDEGSLLVPVTVNMIAAPDIQLNPLSLSTTLGAGETDVLHFSATNTGGSVLRWKISSTTGSPVFDDGAVEPGPVPEPGTFTTKAPSMTPIGGLVYDDVSGFIYAYGRENDLLYKYDLVKNEWAIASTKPGVFVGQGTAVGGKLYYTDSKLNIFSVQNNTWSSVDYPVPGTAGAIANDGLNVYVTLGQTFHKYNPASGNWQTLASVPGHMGVGAGLSFHSGVIYAHESVEGTITGDGTGAFYKYFLESGSWVTSIRTPGKAAFGSAINPSTMQYFVLGSVQSNTDLRIQMSILDMREGTWSKEVIPFDVDWNSSLVYVGKPGVNGIYFSRAIGTSFSKYDTPSSPPWISVTPLKGELAPGATQNFDVHLNPTTLVGGTYIEQIFVSSARPKITRSLPVEVTVAGVPDIAIDKPVINGGDVLVGQSRVQTIRIKNVGNAKLVVTSVTTSHPQFTISNGAFEVPVGEQVTLNVTFTPSTVGAMTGTYVFNNNDPDEEDFEFTFNAKGATPPVINISPASVSATLISGETIKKTVAITNNGGMATSLGIQPDLFSPWFGQPRFTDSPGSIEVGETVHADFILDASGLSTGTYNDKLMVYIAFPGFQLGAQIPVSINVTSATDIGLDKTEIDFGEQFINQTGQKTIEIKNNGVFPLSISSITSNNPAFTISVSAPLNLAAGESANAIVSYTSSQEMVSQGTITFASNDPNEPSLALTLSGSSLGIPQLATNAESLSSTLYMNESESKSLILNNPGFSTLKWQAILEQGVTPGAEPTSADNQFTLLGPVPHPYITPAVNPASGTIYGYDPYNQHISGYNFVNNTWSDPGPGFAPHQKGSSVIMDQRMYVVYPEPLFAVHAESIHVYTIPFREWSTVPNQLGAPIGSITSDGSLLYLAGGGYFKSFNPRTKVWKSLSVPGIIFNGTGGLACHDGLIYAHEGGGTGFAIYNIASDTWETSVSLPGKAMFGGTIDTSRKRYYTYGKDMIYEYDIDARSWASYYVPLFELSDGGIFYKPGPDNEGVYFLQGAAGLGFGKFSPTAGKKWLRVAPLFSDVPESEKTSVAVNFNATGLQIGTYKGKVRLLANDPAETTVVIPVTFNVLDPFPKVSTPEFVHHKFGMNVGLQFFMVPITNNGDGDLEWSFGSSLPAWLTASKANGTTIGHGVEEVKFTIDPSKVTTVQNVKLVINTNDPQKPNVEVELRFTVNLAPVLVANIPPQNLTNLAAQIQLSSHFSDPGDVIVYEATSANTPVATVSVSNSMLTITPVAPGASEVTVKATDVYHEFTTTKFTVNVSQVVGLDDPVISYFTPSPNPFERDLVVRYGVAKPVVSEIVLIDISGRIVLRSGPVNERLGENEIRLDGSGLSTGIYHCALLRNGTQEVGARVLKK